MHNRAVSGKGGAQQGIILVAVIDVWITIAGEVHFLRGQEPGLILSGH